MPPLSLTQSINSIVREDWGRILASLTKSLGDLGLAEDSLQDAVEIALVKWAEQGLPKSPAAWLITTARRKAIDSIRRDQIFTRKQSEIAFLTELEHSESEIDMDALPDKRLELMFTCCHPSLAEKTKVALTLRTIGGLTTEQIAKAFLDNPKTMAQRLTRAKHKIKLAGIPYTIPDKSQLPSRLSDILGVVYLIFNEGYSASSGSNLTRVDLSEEAIRIARILHSLMPEEAEITGLLALMMLHDSRRYARTDETGQMVPLEQQNRNRWDRSKITEGKELLAYAMDQKAIGPYQIQACISALHCEADNWVSTDWSQITVLYELLLRMTPSPVIRLNMAMAISYSQSTTAALEILDEIFPQLETYQPYYALRADLHMRQGDKAQARAAFEKALALSENNAERNFLKAKMQAL